MSYEHTEALMSAANIGPADAKCILKNLHEMGLTIYKKKVAKNGRRAAVSQPLTPKLALEIRKFWMTHPDATQQEIANTFNVNIGRVNEALSGVWRQSWTS
jgi:transcription initiation factor IIE alpha subunit